MSLSSKLVAPAICADYWRINKLSQAQFGNTPLENAKNGQTIPMTGPRMTRKDKTAHKKRLNKETGVNMFLHLGEVLRARRESQDKTLNQVAEGADTDAGSLSRFERTGKGLGMDKVRDAAIFLGVQLSDLYRVLERGVESKRDYNHSINVKAVPVVDWSTPLIDYQAGETKEYVFTSANVGASAIALTVNGESMQPEFADGDTIIVDLTKEPANGQYVVAKQDEHSQATFKKLVIDGTDKYLQPLNNRYPVVTLGPDAFIIGVVVAKQKTYS